MCVPRYAVYADVKAARGLAPASQPRLPRLEPHEWYPETTWLYDRPVLPGARPVDRIALSSSVAAVMSQQLAGKELPHTPTLRFSGFSSNQIFDQEDERLTCARKTGWFETSSNRACTQCNLKYIWRPKHRGIPIRVGISRNCVVTLSEPPPYYCRWRKRLLSVPSWDNGHR